jgi:hypothetical protein
LIVPFASSSSINNVQKEEEEEINVVDKKKKEILFLDDSLIILNAFNNFLILFSLKSKHLKIKIFLMNYFILL